MTTPKITATDKAALTIRELMMARPKQRILRSELIAEMTALNYSESSFDKGLGLMMRDGHVEKIGRRNVIYAWHDDLNSIDTCPRVVNRVQANEVHFFGEKFSDPIAWSIFHCLRVSV